MSFIQSDKFEGSALECARCASGFEFEDLEGKTGISKGRLARFETGRDYPTQSEIEIIANATGMLPSFFFKAWVKAPAHAYNFRLNNER